MDCDFPGKDLSSRQVAGNKCSSTCKSTSGCTHYSWSSYNGGTCWMKTGGASKSDAVYKAGCVCGIVDIGCVPNGLGGCSENGDGSTLAKGKIVWSDEFDYSGQPIDNKWYQVNAGNGFGNNELQFYTNGGKNAQFAGLNLVINSKKEEYGVKLFCKLVFFSFNEQVLKNLLCIKGRKYTSAKLTSKQLFKYCTFEMRAKLPSGRGAWPAFWLLNSPFKSWPRDGEIGNFFKLG